ncbi:ankyrin repeat domain-containing protein [Wolbachia endosymbiont of Oedothorax gibbosus]|uniref:ankyrin repeat domain-containing protein n=1 Tax=Wolbachia endosymbiont of Oedothorax gibbosus TaxID=931100 RepID=UPI0020250E1E|nr:ankyrin repeat domain-containing protein [Wolbachia endosymbiont of Oedothorax gibbosus]
MNREEALKILELTDSHDVISKARKKLFDSEKNSDVLKTQIEAYKSLTDSQAEAFSDLVISAIDSNKLDFLGLLLETVKNDDKFDYLNTESTNGSMPLNFALGNTLGCKLGLRAQIIDLLLKYGANPNAQDRAGQSSLHCVVNNRDGVFCCKVTESLLEYKVDPNARDNQGKTLLHYLCEDHSYLNDCARGRVGIAKLLLRKGANPDLKDNYNKRPVDYAKHDSKVGQLFGAVDRNKVLLYSGGVVISSLFSISCALEATVGNFRKADKIGFIILATGTAACALFCAYCAIKTAFFSKPSTEFTEARAEFLNSQKSAGAV